MTKNASGFKYKHDVLVKYQDIFLWDERETDEDVRVAHWKALHDNAVFNTLHQLLITEYPPEDGESPMPHLIDYSDLSLAHNSVRPCKILQCLHRCLRVLLVHFTMGASGDHGTAHAPRPSAPSLCQSTSILQDELGLQHRPIFSLPCPCCARLSRTLT